MEVYIISGGEPIESEELLFGALEYVQKNRESSMPNLKEIRVFTNGIWLTDETRFFDLVEELNHYDVNSIGISFDKFHVRAAEKKFPEIRPLSRQLIASMKEKLLQKYNGQIELQTIGEFNYYPSPLGRAANLPSCEQARHNNCGLPKRPYLESTIISPQGSVYLCGLEISSSSLGSAIAEPMDNLIERATKNIVLNTLATKGPREVARITGTDISEHYGSFGASFEEDCRACKKIFLELAGIKYNI